MKRTAFLVLTLVAQVQLTFAQAVEVNIPSLSEEGLGNLLTSSLLQTIIYVLAGLAGAMAVSYLVGNLRMAITAKQMDAIYSSRYVSPSDPLSGAGRSGRNLTGLETQLIPVENEREEEEDPRAETKGQRGD